MRRSYRAGVIAAGMVILAQGAGAQAAAQAGDVSRSVEGGGISVPGWTGRIDASEAAAGLTLNSARLSMEGSVLHVTTGPAVAYWNPANRASGSYTVTATFREAKYMSLNNHPHPYGLFIGGNDMGTEQQSYVYCAAYGNGTFIVRGFGPAAFQLNGRRGEANDAVNKAAGTGQPVEQQIAMTVTPDKVECAINGKVVGSYPITDAVGAGKLKSTDGVYGIRFGHNTEGTVTGLTMTRR
jgi:hypothetical protein